MFLVQLIPSVAWRDDFPRSSTKIVTENHSDKTIPFWTSMVTEKQQSEVIWSDLKWFGMIFAQLIVTSSNKFDNFSTCISSSHSRQTWIGSGRLESSPYFFHHFMTGNGWLFVIFGGYVTASQIHPVTCGFPVDIPVRRWWFQALCLMFQSTEHLGSRIPQLIQQQMERDNHLTTIPIPPRCFLRDLGIEADAGILQGLSFTSDPRNDRMTTEALKDGKSPWKFPWKN